MCFKHHKISKKNGLPNSLKLKTLKKSNPSIDYEIPILVFSSLGTVFLLNRQTLDNLSSFRLRVYEQMQ